MRAVAQRDCEGGKRTLWGKGDPMKNLIRQAARFLVDEDGPTTVEYAIMLGVILFGVLSTMASFGSSVQGLYDAIMAEVNAV